MEDRWYLAALLQCPHVGSVRMRRLCAAVPEARKIREMSAAALRATGILSDALADDLARHIQAHPDLPERIAADCARAEVSVITIDDDLYPVVLREIFDPPLVL